jgi:hypothetical protein
MNVGRMEREASRWIAREDEVTRSDRITRLEWLEANYPNCDAGFLFEGGWLALRLFEEARYCFAYGQFLATAILGVAFIEQTLSARFYAEGRDDLERAAGRELLREALTRGWVSQEEFDVLDRVRRLRNQIVHFRRPLAPDTIEHRTLDDGSHPDQVVQDDAQTILITVFGVLQKAAI